MARITHHGQNSHLTLDFQKELKNELASHVDHANKLIESNWNHTHSFHSLGAASKLSLLTKKSPKTCHVTP